MLTELLAFLDELPSYLESVRDIHGEDGTPAGPKIKLVRYHRCCCRRMR